jgi:hypothetical protein
MKQQKKAAEELAQAVAKKELRLPNKTFDAVSQTAEALEHAAGPNKHDKTILLF